MRINTNVQSLAAQRHLGQTRSRQSQAFEQLTSGSRINKAADDAAGLAISEKMRADIRSVAQAARNGLDAVSMVQVAEGGLNETSNMLIRIRELSIQAASDTVGQSERGFIDKEVQQLKQEITRISHITEYNGTKLLDGDPSVLDFQVGIHHEPSTEKISLQLARFSSRAEDIGMGDVSTETREQAQTNLQKVDDAMMAIMGNRSELGALQNRLQATIRHLDIYRENLSEANSRIRDTDVAVATAEKAKEDILAQAGTSVLAQANQSPLNALKLLG